MLIVLKVASLRGWGASVGGVGDVLAGWCGWCACVGSVLARVTWVACLRG